MPNPIKEKLSQNNKTISQRRDYVCGPPKASDLQPIEMSESTHRTLAESLAESCTNMANHMLYMTKGFINGRIGLGALQLLPSGSAD